MERSCGDGLGNMRRMKKLYETLLEPLCQICGIGVTEADILAFLRNHPGRDTARDITELRMLPKANVSQSVEKLIGLGLLCRQPDENDRRLVHLLPTRAAESVLTGIWQAREGFSAVLFADFTPEEQESYRILNEKIANSVYRYLERK